VSTENTADASDPQCEPRDLIGREIAGRIRIFSKLGEGGMGAVYRGEQLSLKRTVAVKVLRPELSANQQLQHRFETEAQAVAKLQHPNIVQVFDFGQDTDGSLFIAMELIDGQSLRAVLTAEAPLRPARAFHIAQQVAASLIEAHSHNIVHRDLKPDNVMLQQKGRQRDVARVLDFGIAKLRDDSRRTQATMTQAGDMLGTPEYMAPEQIRGDAIDGRCDIYALGCLIYEMVTARQPFEATSVVAMLSKHLTENPIPPSRRRPDLGLPPGIDQVVLAAMAKDPNQRPATMEHYADMLAGVMQTLPQDPGYQASATSSAAGATSNSTFQAAHTPQLAFAQPSHQSYAQPYMPGDAEPSLHRKNSSKLPLVLVLGALALGGVGVGVWVPTRNSSSSKDQQDYYKANLNDLGENKRAPTPSGDPWASASGPSMPTPPRASESGPSMPTPPPAPVPAPAPAPRAHPTSRSQTSGRHGYTCDQVANKVLALVTQMLTEKMNEHDGEMTEEQLQKIETEFHKVARVAYAKVVQECTSRDWTDAERACVMNATSLAAAERCK
jgi:serine/threonine protein kinase